MSIGQLFPVRTLSQEKINYGIKDLQNLTVTSPPKIQEGGYNLLTNDFPLVTYLFYILQP